MLARRNGLTDMTGSPGSNRTHAGPLGPRLLEFLGLRRDVVALLAAMVVIGSGEELWMHFAPTYLAPHGSRTTMNRTYHVLKPLLSALYAVPCGIANYLWCPRRALVGFTALSIA